MIELIVFAAGSLGIIYFSRQALTMPNSHGFPRFFAFEAILGLVVLNASRWFYRPLSLPQIISWALLVNSIALAIYSIWVFRTYGEVNSNIQDTTRLMFEKTTRLVIQGPYQFIRHPMYAALLCLAWGVFLKKVNLLSGLLILVVCLTLFLTSVYEERENLSNFGQEYADYMQRTKRFIPFLF
jgi:protein-S-isoprenylcysteine O-methyltransferase Ste14